MTFCNTIISVGEELLAPRPTPKLEDYPSSSVRDILFSPFAGRPLHPLREDVTRDVKEMKRGRAVGTCNATLNSEIFIKRSLLNSKIN
jgi:hypothetical protein